MKRFMTSIAIGTLILGGLTTLGVASASAAGPTITLTRAPVCRLARSWPWPARGSRTTRPSTPSSASTTVPPRIKPTATPTP